MRLEEAIDRMAMRIAQKADDASTLDDMYGNTIWTEDRITEEFELFPELLVNVTIKSSKEMFIDRGDGYITPDFVETVSHTVSVIDFEACDCIHDKEASLSPKVKKMFESALERHIS